MAKTDTHGYTMTGLQKASAAIRKKAGTGEYTEVLYNRTSGEVYTKHVMHQWQSSLTARDGREIVRICTADHPMSAQALADCIARQVAIFEKGEAEYLAMCQEINRTAERK